jgi:D-glycero-D-manno-heptose 1,7-bisphosphate phosphatase
MFEMAEQFYEIDKEHSWMIGDKLIDIQAGKNYHLHTALVGTGYGAKVHEAEKETDGKFPYELYADRLDILAQKILTMDPA